MKHPIYSRNQTKLSYSARNVLKPNFAFCFVPVPFESGTELSESKCFRQKPQFYKRAACSKTISYKGIFFGCKYISKIYPN